MKVNYIMFTPRHKNVTMKNIIATHNPSYPNRGVSISAADIHLRGITHLKLTTPHPSDVWHEPFDTYVSDRSHIYS